MKQKRFRPNLIASYIVLILSSVVLLYPLLFMVLGSFVTIEEYSRVVLIPLPTHIDFTDYFKTISDALPAIEVTLVRVIWYITLALTVSLLAGYVFSRLRFPGRGFLFMFFLTGLVVPPILTSLPTYVMLARTPLIGGNDITGQGGSGFINQWPALLILGMVDVFSMFLVKQSYDMLPTEYEEAALLDGAGLFTIIFRVYAPMLKPALVAVVIITFVNIWNDYYFPLLLVAGNSDLTPVALRIQRIIYNAAEAANLSEFPYPLLFATATLICLPPVILYLILQRYFVQGLAASGLKG
jgi:multiple sugar transport system permease protein